MEKILNDLKFKGCKINGLVIDISGPYNSGKIGNKTWGKLDFMVQSGYTVTGFFNDGIYFPKFNKKRV